ncbi:MAG: glycerate dehydrogenase [Gammaproteobacteria bacterium]|jgi:glycerate dehydrogenase|nr:glycerate dehydrogenase [Gammaproteobacteria bacterium]
MKAVFLDFGTMGAGLDLRELESLVSELVIYDDSPDDTVAERIADAGIVFTNKIRLSRELLEGAPKLRFIALTATGTDNIDTDFAAGHGIGVANIRHYCTQSVVEHVFGVLLSLTHSLGSYHRSVQAGDWQRSTDFCMLHYPVKELSAMTLGIVGYGALGQGVARIAREFGMKVLVSARPGSDGVAEGRVPFDELLATSDVISLHCPLTGDTRNLFGAREFEAMKANAIFINTARGGLVDSQALADALANGEIAAAAIDVLPKEPPVAGDPLLDYDRDNLIVTPHIAWATDEARQNAIDELVANTRAFLDGVDRNRVV